MKKEMNTALGRLKRHSVFFAPLMAAMIGFASLEARAAVQATRFVPPLKISVGDQPPNNLATPLNNLTTDFNLDGQMDFRLMYGSGWMGAYFNAPTRFATRATQPNPVVPGGVVAAIPLNSIIGTNIISRSTNNFAWSLGCTNDYDFTQPLGDHQATVIVENFVTPTQAGPIISISTNGTLVTNVYWPLPIAIGDVVNREAVMAVQFYINGEAHYGYIHFDFRSGGDGGYIYGWAYETKPNVAIKAVPLSNALPRTHQPQPRVAEPKSKPRLEPAD